VKKILNGEQVAIRSAYVNPDSLDLFHDIPQLRNYWNDHVEWIDYLHVYTLIDQPGTSLGVVW